MGVPPMIWQAHFAETHPHLTKKMKKKTGPIYDSNGMLVQMSKQELEDSQNQWVEMMRTKVTLTVFNRERHLLKKPKPNLHEELQRLTHEAKAILFLKCEASRLCHERRRETCATVAWTTMWCQG